MVKIKMYTTGTCAFCHAQKNYLDQKGIKYEEKRVDLDPAAANEMITLSGQMGVPFSVITHEDGKQEGVLGFNRAHLDEVLGLK